MRFIRPLITLLLLLCTASAWAGMPTFIANGSSTVTASTGTCTPTMPGSILANDILLAVGCGEGFDDSVAVTLSTANGFAQVGTEQRASNGTSESNPDINCSVFWKRAVGSDSAPVFADSGDHTTCAVHQFRGVRTTGDPWNVEAEGNDGGANDTSGVIPGAATTTDNALVVLIQGTSNNANSTANCSSWSNADLATLTERFDSTNTSALGGGHCMATGGKASAGSYTNTTVTLSATTYKAAFSIALEGAVSTCPPTLRTLGVGC